MTFVTVDRMWYASSISNRNDEQVCQISKVVDAKQGRQEIEQRIFKNGEYDRTIISYILEPKPEYSLPAICQVVPFEKDKFLGSSIVDGELTWFVT